METYEYSPACFNSTTLADARLIILTNEEDTSEVRWEKETPYLLDLISQKYQITSSTKILDYGCGIGRLAKGLIDRFDCLVVGTDIAPNMRVFATDYVRSPNFVVCNPIALDKMEMEFDLALSIWVLQHCFRPQDDITRIRNSLKYGGDFLVVNNNERVVPTTSGAWISDSIDMSELLRKNFKSTSFGLLDPAFVSQPTVDRTFVGYCRKF